MHEIDVKYESFYSYEGRLDVPNVSYSTWSLLSFATSYCVPDIANAIEHFGVIPPRHLMNEAFERGRSINRAFGEDQTTGYGWTPFRISGDEYRALSADLIADSSNRKRIADESLWSRSDIVEWYTALKQKIDTDPTYTKLSWHSQHGLLGLPIAENRWISRYRDFARRKANKIDGILKPLKAFFRDMQHCTPDCCEIAAYNFFAETILMSADKLGRATVMRQLRDVEIDLGELDESIEVLSSEMLNSRLMRSELVVLIEHISTVLSAHTPIGQS